MTRRSWLLSCLVVLGLATTTVAEKVDKPNPAFAGRIMLSDKRFPTSAKSLTAFNASVRKQSKESFAENKDTKSWKIYFAGFLRNPLNDVEYVVKIYDITGGKQQLLVSFDQFTDQRGQAALMSSMTLERKMVGVNKQLLMTMDNKGKTLASARFKILGEGERSSGKVDFSEEEANGSKKLDDDE